MNRSLLSLLLGLSLVSAGAQATTTIYADSAAFATAISGGTSSTENFDGTAFLTTIPSGSTLNGITYTYTLPGSADLMVQSGFDTTSSPHSLGANGSTSGIASGSGYTMTFAATNAIGMNIIIADATLGDGAVVLTAATAVGTVSLDASEVMQNFAPNASARNAYFLGVINDSFTFTSANLSSPNGVTFNIEYFVDDITLATLDAPPIPIPAALPLFISALFMGGVFTRRRRSIRG